MIEQLGGKQLVMNHMHHEDQLVRYNALLAVQKLMVHNWYELVRSFLLAKRRSVSELSRGAAPAWRWPSPPSAYRWLKAARPRAPIRSFIYSCWLCSTLSGNMVKIAEGQWRSVLIRVRRSHRTKLHVHWRLIYDSAWTGQRRCGNSPHSRCSFLRSDRQMCCGDGNLQKEFSVLEMQQHK